MGHPASHQPARGLVIVARMDEDNREVKSYIVLPPARLTRAFLLTGVRTPGNINKSELSTLEEAVEAVLVSKSARPSVRRQLAEVQAARGELTLLWPSCLAAAGGMPSDEGSTSRADQKPPYASLGQSCPFRAASPCRLMSCLKTFRLFGRGSGTAQKQKSAANSRTRRRAPGHRSFAIDREANITN